MTGRTAAIGLACGNILKARLFVTKNDRVTVSMAKDALYQLWRTAYEEGRESSGEDSQEEVN